MKVYSKLKDIKLAVAPETVVPGCLVLEGGALRGVYTAGVLDVLMENGINMETTVGVSAGAMNGISYVGGHIGRAAMCDLEFRYDSRFIGLRALIESGSVTGFRFMFREFTDKYPLNENRLFRGGRKLFAVATNLETGEAEFFENIHRETFFRAVCASASMPFVSKKIEINGKYYLDGGCKVKIPISWALDKGFDKIVVVNTREKTYRRKEKKESGLAGKIYKKYPDFVKSLTETNKNYNLDCDLLEKLEEEGRVFRICPSETVTVSRLEKDMEKLGELYELGRHDASSRLEELKKYLEI